MMPVAPQTCARQISPDSGSPLSLFLASALLYSQVNSDSLNCPESESFPRAPLISLPSAAVVPHSGAGSIICRVGTLKLCVKAGMRTQSRLSAVIIRLCRLCPTEIDVKVNLFQICDPRGEVAATSSHLVSQRQTESRFRPRKHVKSGSNYHCCSNICISESDKLLTLCDILTVSPAVQLS